MDLKIPMTRGVICDSSMVDEPEAGPLLKKWRIHSVRITGALLVVFCSLFCSCRENSKPDPIPESRGFICENDSIQNAFTLDEVWFSQLSQKFKVPLQDTHALRLFYASRGDRFVWVHPEGFTFATKGFLDRLSSSADEGVILRNTNPRSLVDLCASYLDSFPIRTASSGLCSLEISLTAAWFEYATAAYSGLPIEKRRELQWYLPSTQHDPTMLLQSFLADTMSATGMHPWFNYLAPLVRHYRTISGLNWGAPLKDHSPGKVSRSDALMAVVKKRLFLLKDIPDSTCGPGTTAAGIRNFRVRHGLGDESVLDVRTLVELDVPPKKRLLKMLVNLERCRWLPKEFSARYILVNIPEFSMRVVSNDSLLWISDVVVGKTTSETAIFSGKMTRVVLNPYWNVPFKILKTELIPRLRRDPGFLQRNHYEVAKRGQPPMVITDPIDWKNVNPATFPYFIRQQPGPWNALGKVKFLFPNSFDMYLHDTPSRQLFSLRDRAFSHGCVRISEPDRLLYKVLECDTAWTPQDIQDTIATGIEKVIDLKKPWPVYILYFTAWADSLGNVSFRDDVYRHDSVMIREFWQEPLE